MRMKKTKAEELPLMSLELRVLPKELMIPESCDETGKTLTIDPDLDFGGASKILMEREYASGCSLVRGTEMVACMRRAVEGIRRCS